MKSIIKSAILTVALFAGNILHAQLQFSSADLATIEATTPLSTDQVPVIGTFYSAANPQYPPAPADVLGWPAWDVGSLDGIEIYLLDDLDGSSGGGFHAMDDSDPLPPGGGTNDGSYSFTNTYAGFPTNGLWLQITNISEGLVYANLHGATDFVYEIYSTTNLAVAATAVSNWDIETEVFPVNTNTTPFYVPMNGRPNLFLWARDWTGITSDGNTVPEWWLWEYFDTVDISDTNLDSLGQNTLLYDFQNGIEPNVILFSLQFTNDYFYANPASGTVSIESGEPGYEAVLINDQDFDDAIWQPLTSTNLSIDLGPTNGAYSVLVGLRGFGTNVTATWQGMQLTLNATPFLLTVTNPVSSMVSQPLIQVQGYVARPLASVTFDVSNAAGIFTNQTGYITSQYYDPNSQAFTTNYFQCFDVRMASGLNIVTLHATDTEGETTSASEAFEYSPGTNPPALTVLWPQDGTLVSGTSFTLQGQVDDDTASVTVQITDTNGDMNTVQGLVERNGTVWVNNLPLAPGTNIVTLTATNAAGYSMTTNLTLVQSPVIVTLNPLTQLNQSTVSVTGTISDESYDVYVNGVEASYLDTNGDWEADGVPVSPTGTATFNVQVYFGDPVLSGTENFNQDQPPMVVLKDYSYSDASVSVESGEFGYDETFTTTYQWDYKSGGESSFLQIGAGAGEEGYAAPWHPVYDADNSNIGPDTTNDWFVFTPFWETASWSTSDDSGNDQSTLMLTPSGKAVPGVTDLAVVEAQVTNEITGLQEPASEVQFSSQMQGTASVDVTNADNSVWTAALVSYPAGTMPTVTPKGNNISYNGMQSTNLSLEIIDNNTSNVISGQTNTVIVGQQMNLSCKLSVTNASSWNSMLTNFQWTVPGDAISNYVVAPDTSSAMVVANFPTTNSTATFFWVDAGSNRTLQCSAMINGAALTGKAIINVVRPTARITSQTGIVQFGENEQNSGYGVYFGTYGSPSGIVFSPNLVLPSGQFNYGNTNYQFQWVQVIIPAYSGILEIGGSNIVTWTKTTTNIVLDTQYPYGFNPFPNTDDSPGVATDTPNAIAGSFSQKSEMWLMFQPANGQTVPLREVTWYCSGSATNSGGNWAVTSASWWTNPPDADAATTYPTWTNNIANIPIEISTN